MYDVSNGFVVSASPLEGRIEVRTASPREPEITMFTLIRSKQVLSTSWPVSGESKRTSSSSGYLVPEFMSEAQLACIWARLKRWYNGSRFLPHVALLPPSYCARVLAAVVIEWWVAASGTPVGAFTPVAVQAEGAVNRMRHSWILVACLATVLVGGAGLAIWRSDDLNRWRTLAGVRKVDEHPLYVMRYYGDYHLERFLRTDAGDATRLERAPAEVALDWACTCFASLNCESALLLGRNFDWMEPNPALLLFAAPTDAYASVSMVDISYLGFASGIPSWSDRSRLLDAIYMPFDGMNEFGLAVSMMAVPEANCGHDPQKQTISGLNAIRLMLDYAKDVGEAVALLSDYNIAFGGPPLHYLVADATGSSAVVECVDGDMRVLYSDTPWQVSTNFVISERDADEYDSGCWRYRSAQIALRDVDGCLSREQAMALLEDVSQPGTLWSIVYGISGGYLDVAMGRKYSNVYTFTLSR